MNDKRRFMRRIGSDYYTFSDSNFKVVSSIWLNTAEDYFALKSGAIFRTRKEANEERKRLFKELTGKELEV